VAMGLTYYLSVILITDITIDPKPSRHFLWMCEGNAWQLAVT